MPSGGGTKLEADVVVEEEAVEVAVFGVVEELGESVMLGG